MFTLAVKPARTSRLAASGTLRALWVLVLATGLVAPRQARPQAPTDGTPSQSLWTRDTLGGDWGGFRDALGQQGVRLDFWATGFYQDMFKGAGNDDGDFSGRADLMINGDTGKLGLWQGGGLHAHVTYRGGDLPAFRGGALFPVHTSGLLPQGGKDEVVATSLYLSQRFGDATRLMLGKIHAIDFLASHPFFGGWGTDRFWNVAFVAPPSGVVPPVIMGGILTHSFAPYSLTAMVFNPNDQTTSDSFNRLFDDGVNVSLGLARSGEFAGGKSGAAITDGNPNPFKRSFVGGVAGHVIIPGRPLDYFGVGCFFYDISDQLRDAVAPVGSSAKDEQGIEAYYAFVPTPWLRLSANLQSANPANGANPSTWLGGLRARLVF